MHVLVGDILLDRDSRRKGREVEVVEVNEDTVVVKTIKTPGGVLVGNGNTTEIKKSRLEKAYRHKFATGGPVLKGEGLLGAGEEFVAVNSHEFKLADTSKLALKIEDDLKEDIIKEIMKLAEPGNKIVLDRITALESRVNNIEYGKAPTDTSPYVGYQVTCDGSIDPNHVKEVLESQTITNRYYGGYTDINSVTGSVVSNYPTLEEVLEKVLPQTEEDDFEQLWDMYCEDDSKNPHEVLVRLVYNVMTSK